MCKFFQQRSTFLRFLLKMNEQLTNVSHALQCLESFCCVYSIYMAYCLHSKPAEASLEHLNYSKTIRRPVLCSAHLGSWQHSPDPIACGERAGFPFPKNPTPTSAVRTSGCGLSGLANPLSNYPSTSRYPPTLLVLCQHGTTSCT